VALASCVLLIMLFATLIIAAQERSERRQVEARMGATSALAVAFVHEQTSGLAALVAAYGDRLASSGALAASRGSKATDAAVAGNLERLAEARPGISVTFLTDARGALIAVRPATPAQLGKSFAFRDWYQGAVMTRRPYISEAYQSLAAGRPFVIAASVVVQGQRAGPGPEPILGVLSATYGLASFQKFVDGYAASTGIRLLIVDQRGVLMADAGHPAKPGTSLEERRAAGRSAIAANGSLSAKTTDRGTGWTVISQVPLQAALGPATDFRNVVLVAAGLLLLVLIGGAWSASRIRRNRQTAERRIRESEDRAEREHQRGREDIDRFFSLSRDLLCIASTDGYFKQLNPAWQDVLGYENGELIDRPFVAFIHPDDLENTAAEVGRLMGGSASVAFENRYRRRDGSYRWLLWNVTPLPEEGLMYGVARDNTVRREVEQATARLAAIVDSSVDAIIGATLDGTVTSWNRGAEQTFGYLFDEIVGRSIEVLTPVNDSQQADMLSRAAEGEVIAPYEAPRLRRDGQLIDVALTTSPVRDPDGAVTGISMIARDISETKRTAEALRAIIATASDAFVSMAGNGLITEWNHSAETLFGWPREEALGRELAELIIPQQHRDAHRAGLSRVLNGGEAHILDQLIEVTAVHRNGGEIPVELAVWRVSAGQAPQFSAFVRDISERKQIANDVVAARDQALEASRLKSAFLATMSHEIRTPMNGVIGLTGLLLRGDLQESQRRYADGIRVAGNALLAVINDILDFSKIEAGALILEDTIFNIGAILEDVIALVSETARSKNVELLGFCDPSLPASLRGDPVRIRQILLNLASNAVKFTDEGEVIVHLRLARSEPLADQKSAFDGEKVTVHFEVRDTGIGIQPADRARLFDPFAQADSSTTRRFGGTGLGLAICRELVEAMGGDIGVRSRPGGGSVFWVTIALRPDPANVDHTPAPAVTNMAASRAKAIQGAKPTLTSAPAVPTSASAVSRLGQLLLVEDNDINQMVAVGILNELGYAVDVAADGVEALALISRNTYQAVLMDCQMPRMDGYEATAEIRRREAIAQKRDLAGEARLPSRLPIIAMTAAAQQEDRDRCLAAGMDDFLTKPIHADTLAAALVRWTTGAPIRPVDSLPRERVSTAESILDRLDELRDQSAAGLVARLVTSFLERAPGYLSELTDTLGRDDFDAFTRAAHSLNGAAGNLGASTMADLCDGLETLGHDRQTQSAPHLLDRLRVEYVVVRRILEDIAA